MAMSYKEFLNQFKDLDYICEYLAGQQATKCRIVCPVFSINDKSETYQTGEEFTWGWHITFNDEDETYRVIITYDQMEELSRNILDECIYDGSITMSEGDIPHQRHHSLAYQRWQARRFIENSRLINPLDQTINWWMNHCEEVVEAMNTIDKIEFYLGNIEKIGSLRNRKWVS